MAFRVARDLSVRTSNSLRVSATHFVRARAGAQGVGPMPNAPTARRTGRRRPRVGRSIGVEFRMQAIDTNDGRVAIGGDFLLALPLRTRPLGVAWQSNPLVALRRRETGSNYIFVITE